MTYCDAVLMEWSSEFGGGSIDCLLALGHDGPHASETGNATVLWWTDVEKERALPIDWGAHNDGDVGDSGVNSSQNEGAP